MKLGKYVVNTGIIVTVVRVDFKEGLVYWNYPQLPNQEYWSTLGSFIGYAKYLPNLEDELEDL